MQKPASDKKPAVQTSVPDKHIEASQTRQRTRSNLGQRLPTYAKEYALVYTLPGYIIAMNTIISRRT